MLECDDYDALLKNIIYKIHTQGPVDPHSFEELSYIKYMHPDIFEKQENTLMHVLGVFYKTRNPQTVLSLVYSSFKEMIEEKTHHLYTPSQASIYEHIKKNKIFSFSAPTSAGKSYVFRDLIREEEGDIVIIVPSRALIAEYLIHIRRILQAKTNILVLQHIDNINRNHVKRKIFVVTPERAMEIFNPTHQLRISLFLFDEAQICEEPIRGVTFDSLVRRALRIFPNTKKVFCHPFIENPEAQFAKHNLTEDVSSFVYQQNSVGKLFIRGDDGLSTFSIFSPYDEKAHHKKNVIHLEDDIIENIITKKGCVLIYVSKRSIYTSKIKTDFLKYINLCQDIDDPFAIEIIEKIREHIGSKNIKSEFIEYLSRGIVIHHGSVPLIVRSLIEKFINAGFARICFATSTLLQGVNLPFDAIFIDRFNFGDTKIESKSLNLKNLIGRAGRTMLKKINSFDYGFVIIKGSNVQTFVDYIKIPTKLESTSILDSQAHSEEDDEYEFIESVKSGEIDSELGLPKIEIQRLSSDEVENNISILLEYLFHEKKLITGKEYNNLKESLRTKIKDSFKYIFRQSLNRDLTEYEESVLSSSITILLWKIQGKTFKQTVTLRYNYITKKDEIRNERKKLKDSLITQEEFDAYCNNLKIKNSVAATKLPNKNIKYNFLFKQNTNIADINYDVVLFDTYDYLDEVISFSLSGKFIAAFENYYRKTYDIRAKYMVNIFRYGTNDDKEIMLLRYGFSFEDIENIYDHVTEVSENEIIFADSIRNLNNTYIKELIHRYI
ncbi:hypothetical protein AC781_08810 [Akkermansia glycaniphila]|nr:hypothetical protein AC781_08810 [Akkermansia glycaniphila]